MKVISAREFWRLYSYSQIHHNKIDELPVELSYGAFFDRYFGRLTRHRIKSLTKGNIVTECLNCSYAINEKIDACEAHIGILQGLFEKELKISLKATKKIDDGICKLSYFISDE